MHPLGKAHGGALNGLNSREGTGDGMKTIEEMDARKAATNAARYQEYAARQNTTKGLESRKANLRKAAEQYRVAADLLDTLYQTDNRQEQ